MKHAKEYLASGEPLPEGISPESFPAAMSPDALSDYVGRDFLQVTPLDKVGRRALWMRFSGFDPDANIYEPDGQCIELKAGREGDDDYIVLRDSGILTKKDIKNIVNLLLRVMDAYQ